MIFNILLPNVTFSGVEQLGVFPPTLFVAVLFVAEVFFRGMLARHRSVPSGLPIWSDWVHAAVHSRGLWTGIAPEGFWWLHA